MVAIGNLSGYYSQAGRCRVGRREVLQSSYALHSPSGMFSTMFPTFPSTLVLHCEFYEIDRDLTVFKLRCAKGITSVFRL